LLGLADTSMGPVTGLPPGLNAKPFFTDGFGPRYLTFDLESGTDSDPIEIPAFDRALVEPAKGRR
jgi:hypothetical protein